MSNFLSEESTPGGTKDPSEDSFDSSGAPSAFPHDKELESLRQLLFARELALLEDVVRNQREKRFNAEKISEVIAESITLRAGRDKQINVALEPVVDDIFKKSLTRRKNDFVKLLFPLIGPVIRKSISETLLSMLSNISQSLEVAFSWRGLRWRFESWRSGRPFNEIVLLHSVIYRVEQIFFIHSETGLLLSHVVNEKVPAQDADMVSGMLTAIQDFVQDSFSGNEDNTLQSLHMGEISLIIEKNDMAYVACVVRGTPPADFRASLQDSFDMMLVEYAEPLAEFSGDTSPFLTAVRYLQPLLLSRYTKEEKKIPFWAKSVSVICLLGILSWGGYIWHEKRTRNTEIKKALLLLNEFPGIIVTNVVEHGNGPWEALTFRDELAPFPEKILQKNGFSPTLIDFTTIPFISYDSSIILRRIKDVLSPPDTVTMEFKKDGALILTGDASMNWIFRARDVVKTVPGVKDVDISGLHNPLMDQAWELIREVNGASVLFPLGKDTPVGKELAKLEEVVNKLVQLEKIARKNDLVLSLTIYGHADAVGSEKKNYEISQARTKTVAARLYAKHSNILISTYGMGSEFSKDCSRENMYTGDQSSRKIEFHATLSRAVSVDSLFGDE